MHLGRFHAVITDLVTHLKVANLFESLEIASTAIGNYASNRDAAELSRYQDAISQVRRSANVSDPDLLQPFAKQVTEDLGLTDLVNPALSDNLDLIISRSNYDPAGLSDQIKNFSELLLAKVVLLRQMENSLTKLDVEYERVSDGEAEIGFMLPREVVGDRLSDLSNEFDKLNKLAGAIAEISGDTDEYEPRIRTLASSWWQIFLDLTPEQIAIWVIAIERIVNLFKANLEIKNLTNQLREQKMPEKITKLIEDEIDKRVKADLRKVSADIKKQHSKNRDQARMNELETQLRQGLFYLAKRLNQGMQVEINLSIPAEPEEPEIAEGADVDADVIREIENKRAEIAKLVALRNRALAISEQTREIGEDAPLLIQLDAVELDDD